MHTIGPHTPALRRSSASRAIKTLIGVVVVAIVAGLIVHLTHRPQAADKLMLDPASTAQFKLETVKTAAAQEQGLSGRVGLAKNAGMMFAYNDVAKRCMWMKDMRFNLDIVWLDAGHRVTSLVSNLTPATYPQSYCAQAKYVVELNAGTAWANGLRVGQIVKL